MRLKKEKRSSKNSAVGQKETERVQKMAVKSTVELKEDRTSIKAKQKRVRPSIRRKIRVNLATKKQSQRKNPQKNQKN